MISTTCSHSSSLAATSSSFQPAVSILRPFPTQSRRITTTTRLRLPAFTCQPPVIHKFNTNKTLHRKIYLLDWHIFNLKLSVCINIFFLQQWKMYKSFTYHFLAILYINHLPNLFNKHFIVLYFLRNYRLYTFELRETKYFCHC